MPLSLSPLIRFGTSTWTYEGWQGQVYQRQYAKSSFAQDYFGGTASIRASRLGYE